MSFVNNLKNKLQEIRDQQHIDIDHDSEGTIITDPQQRLDICHSCDAYFKFTKQCKKCGCFLPAKVRLKSSRCPLKKW